MAVGQTLTLSKLILLSLSSYSVEYLFDLKENT